MTSPSRSRPSPVPGRFGIPVNRARCMPSCPAPPRSADLAESVAVNPQLVLRHRLKESGLWLPDDRHEFVLSRCKARGELLKKEVLKDVLDPSDNGFVGTADAFGVENRRFRRSLASVLSFGFHLGAAFADWLKVRQQRENIATTCALFAAMTMLFDLCLDDIPNGADILFQVLDESAMRRLVGGGLDLIPIAARHSVPEIRITLKMLFAFYERSRALAETSRDTKLWRHINDLVMDAYRAEMRTLQAHNLGELAETAAAAKRLPVEIMFHLAVAGDPGQSTEAYLEGARLAREIGGMLWLTDDLADLVKDLRSGSANAIVCEARTLLPHGFAADEGLVMRCVIDNQLVEQKADAVCRTLGHVTAFLEPYRPSCPEDLDFRHLLWTFVRSWSK